MSSEIQTPAFGKRQPGEGKPFGNIQSIVSAAQAEMEAIKGAEAANSLGMADLCEKENKNGLLLVESFEQ